MISIDSGILFYFFKKNFHLGLVVILRFV
uniref:Uncharacterized protein n=1 Tax=Rhizophora mucronata TaxID=61149 RepID=A0A2P2NK41_RHIMU